MYFTILTLLVVIFVSLVTVRKTVEAMKWVALEIKCYLNHREVEKMCNRNTQVRLAQVLEMLGKKDARIREQEECIHRCGASLSSLQEEVDNLKEENQKISNSQEFNRETISELKDCVSGQDSLILTLQERVSLFSDIISELHEELEIQNTSWASDEVQEAASLEAAANKLRRAQLREEKKLMRAAKQAREHANMPGADPLKLGLELEAANKAYEIAFLKNDGMPIPYELVMRCKRAQAALKTR